MKAKVYNKRAGKVPADAIYIGRPSKWGNPWVVNVHGSREQVIRWYRDWLWLDRAAPNGDRPPSIADIRKELHGKNLVCFCAPLACHGDVLLEIANKES